MLYFTEVNKINRPHVKSEVIGGKGFGESILFFGENIYFFFDNFIFYAFCTKKIKNKKVIWLDFKKILNKHNFDLLLNE